MASHSQGDQDRVIGLAYELSTKAGYVATEADLDELIQTVRQLTAAVNDDIETLGSILSDKEWQERVKKMSQQIRHNPSSPADRLISTASDRLERYIEIYHQREEHLQELQQLAEALELHKPFLCYKGRSDPEIDTHTHIRQACERLVERLGISLREET